MRKIFFIFGVCFLVSACGFEPMYGTKFQNSNARQTDIGSELAHIQITNIPDREGQYLRNALIDRFYREGRPSEVHYTLSVAPIQESTIDLDITKNSDATRAQLRLKTQMTLTDNRSGEVVLQRALNSISSYNVLTSEFATRVSAQNTRENALDDLARQIELKIGLYLRR